MTVPSVLLFLLGVLGATDILLYHSISHGIREHHDSRAELFTHFLRGPTYAALFLLVPNFAFRGWWVIGLLALYLFDVGISIADFWLESGSRRGLGGLPRGEYVLHVILAMLFGALVAATVYECGGAIGADSALVWRTDSGPHPLLRIALGLMAPLVLWSGIADLRAMFALSRKTP
jgi:hypothetical protein